MSRKFKFRWQSILIVILSVLLITPVIGFAANNQSDKASTQILFIPYGSNQEQLGVIPQSPGILPEGPLSFFVNGDTYVILDTVKKRIVYYKKGSFAKEIKLDFTVKPADIVSDGKNIYVFDRQDKPMVYKIDGDGRILNIYTVDIPDFNITKNALRWLTLTKKETVAVVDCFNDEYELNEQAKGVKTVSKGISSKYSDTVFVGKKGSDEKVHYLSTDIGVKVPLSINSLPAGADIVGFDIKGNIYVQVGDRAETSLVIVESTVRKFDKKGNQVGIVRLPLEECNNYPTRAVYVTPAGVVYFMALKQNGVEIKELFLGDSYISTIKEKEHKQKAIESQDIGTKPIAVAAVNSRQATNDRAYAINNLDWWYAEFNASPVPSGATRPNWLVRTGYGWHTGIPYCWGGFDAIDRSSRPSSWSSFNDAMNKKKFAGNINCTGNYKEGTAGLDCSGYVGACLGYTTKPSTITLWNNSRPVSYATWMDSYNNYSGHVLLFLNIANDQGINTCETATDLYNEKTQVAYRSYNWLNSLGMQCRTFW